MGNNQSQDSDNITITRLDSSATISKPTPPTTTNDTRTPSAANPAIPKHPPSSTKAESTSGTHKKKKSNKQDSNQKIDFKPEIVGATLNGNKDVNNDDASPSPSPQHKRAYNSTRARRSTLFEGRPVLTSLFPDGASTQIQISKDSKERMEEVLRASGKFDLANLSQEELEWRPRSNSVAVPFFGKQQSDPKLEPGMSIYFLVFLLSFLCYIHFYSMISSITCTKGFHIHGSFKESFSPY